MDAALWGLAAALAWGVADFCGRFTGRRLGVASAVLGLMLVGAALLSLYGIISGLRLPAVAGSAVAGPVWAALVAGPVWAALVAAVSAIVAPLAFYRGMVLAPMSLVLPIAAAYPALLVPAAVMLGARPSAVEWAGMAATVVGAVVVARTAADDPDAKVAADPANRRRAVLYAMAAAVLFAIALGVGEHAAAAYGAVETLWFGRVVGTGVLLAAFAVSRRPPCLPLRWGPVLLLQGVLDAAAYFCFFTGADGEDAPVAAVTSSAFMVVGVLLGWVFLKERIGAACWSGIALVFGGVAVLSWAGVGAG